MDAIGAWLEFALRSWMSSSTNAGSPSAWRDEIALEAEPRLTLRIAGASGLVVQCFLTVGALLQWARVPSGTTISIDGASLPAEGLRSGRSLFSLASIDSVTDGCIRGTTLRCLELRGGMAQLGYRVAPLTIGSPTWYPADWMFALAPKPPLTLCGMIGSLTN